MTTSQLHPYSVIYQDRREQRREFCLYARDAYQARLTAQELAEPVRIVQIIKQDADFDW